MKESNASKYRKFLQEFKDGKYGEKSLRQVCIELGYSYQQVINVK